MLVSEHTPHTKITSLPYSDRFRAVELWIRKLLRALDKGEHNRRYAQKALSLLPIDSVKLTDELALSVEEIRETS